MREMAQTDRQAVTSTGLKAALPEPNPNTGSKRQTPWGGEEGKTAGLLVHTCKILADKGRSGGGTGTGLTTG